MPGRSNAFAISERLGMDPELIARAKEFVSSESVRFEDVMDSLEQSRLDMEAQQRASEDIRREYEQTLAEARRKLEEAETLRQKEYDKAKSEALKISEKARREANALMLEAETLRKELRTSKDVSETARKARQSMKKALSDLDVAIDPVTETLYDDEDYVLPRELKAGDTVLYIDLGKEAQVLTPKDRKGNVEIMAGTARMRVNESRLRLIEKKKQPPAKSVPTISRQGTESRLTASADGRCDLRGMTVDEALLTLDSFISSMLMSGLNEFTVIHGKGTGALRAAVQKALKGNKFVKSYRLGTYGEGENGVTIVTLK